MKILKWLIIGAVALLFPFIGIPALIIYYIYVQFKKNKVEKSNTNTRKNSFSNTSENRCVVNYVNKNEWGKVELYFECWNETQVLNPKTSRQFTLIIGSKVIIKNEEHGDERIQIVKGSSMYHEDYYVV